MGSADASEPDWNRIERFIGFGNEHAPVVFIGIEEGLKDASGLDAELAIRSTYERPVMDLKAAFRDDPAADAVFDPDRGFRQPTWRVMCDLMLRRRGEEPTTLGRQQYRALELGREASDSLLTELLPYPHPKNSDWLYARFRRYKTREMYEKQMIPARSELLRDFLARAPRETVVCYGMSYCPRFQDLFPGVRWRENPDYVFGHQGDTRVVISRHFATKYFNTNEQLARLADVALRRE